MAFKLSYSSTKFIRVENTCLALLYYITLVGLLAYVIIYQIWYKGGYQKTSPFDGAVDIKVKGAGFLGDVDDCRPIDWPHCGPYDMADASLPPMQEGAVFVSTSFYSTPDQQRGFCDSRVKCKTSADCPKGNVGSGSSAATLTGNCNATTGACEMAAWCPPEASKKILNADKRNLTDTGNFTIFFRVDGSFSEFDTIFSTGDDLIYNYNLFYLSDVVAYSQGVDIYPTANVSAGEEVSGRPDTTSFEDVVGDGTVIFLSATIMQNGSSIEDAKPCNLDNPVPDCVIDFQFTRVDPSDASSASHGYNYRYTNPWSLATNGTRSLTKVFGTRIVFQVGGEGAQFDLITLTVAVGSGIGMLSLAKVICDYILMFICTRKYPQYRAKYEVVDEGSKPTEEDLENFGAGTTGEPTGTGAGGSSTLRDPLFPSESRQANI